MSSFYHNLRQEFDSLSQIRQSSKYTAEHGPPPPAPPEQAATTSASTVVTNGNLEATATIITQEELPQQQQQQQQSKQYNTNVASVQFVSFQTELYPLIHPTLSKKLPLKNVKYKSRLNGNEATIAKLPIELQHVNANLVPAGGNVIFEGSNDVTAPYCRVYIITIESAEEYRSTIKPVLKKWVGERDKAKEQYLILCVDEYASSPGSNANNTSSNSSSNNHAYGSNGDGVTTDGHSSSNHNSIGNNGGSSDGISVATNSAASKIAAFRNRLSEIKGGNNDGVQDVSQATPAAKHQLAKELFRRLSYDFGAAKTAMVSPVSLFKKDSSLWAKFVSQLGQVIVTAFERRSASLDEKLRRMLDQRVKDKGVWNFADFFLLKEKLACTFEHLQLEREALLQYEELGAFVFAEPDLPIAKTTTTTQQSNAGSNVVGVATDNTAEFMQRLEQKQVTAQELYQHLFERESHFNFLLSRPIEALVLARRFIISSYKRFLDNPNFSKSDAEMFAFGACWEVYEASKEFFAFESDEASIDPHESLYSSEERFTASQFLSSLLEFGRRRLLKCGKEFGVLSTTILRATGTVPHQTLGTWEPWDEISKLSSSQHSKDSADDKQVADIHYKDQLRIVSDEPTWVRKALFSEDSFDSAYLDLSKTIIVLFEKNQFVRSAIRVKNECAEICILRKDFVSAAQFLQPLTQSKVLDANWDRVYSWLLFRFACCQRHLKTPKEYLPTLIHSFSPRLASVAPEIALKYLLSDLEAIVADSAVSSERFRMFPFLETEISIIPTSEGKRTFLHTGKRRRLTLHRCEVGEKISIVCKFLSYFPRDTTIDELKIVVTKMEDFDRHKHGDHEAFRPLSIAGPITVFPGKNELVFDWIPMSMGEFMLTNLSLRWGKAEFVHESPTGSYSRRPVPGLEVIQSTPTQKIELAPLPFLLPGAKQTIQSTYHSGNDHIFGGKIEFTCSEGLEILPPSFPDVDDNWCRKISILVEKSSSDAKVVHKIPVRALSNVSSFDEVKVVVATSFRHALYYECDAEPPSDEMHCTLDGFLSVQTCSALTVGTCKAYPCDDGVMLRLSMRSSSPVPFFVKKCGIQISPPFELIVPSEDVNEGLFNRVISVNEELMYAFQCRRQENNSPVNGVVRAEVDVNIEDEFGKIHDQKLQLNFECEEHLSDLADDNNNNSNSENASLSVSLECVLKEGSIGAPVPFTFLVDATKFPVEEGKVFVYNIFCDERDWLLSGRVRGILKAGGKTELSFVGIPTRVGILTVFPEIKIHNESFGDMNCSRPETFLSRPHKNNMALAFPSMHNV
eukprot:CAMPEP_0196807614 /NCGR_PEP_ID=MMETSP1362-20130617/7605_1 /TAXON_ID=163516 /ORGANISM="Leptocylindrus danicus, Strain CCMP1856" /LENGTH=1304 /DNA_ID=CAMNT_0042181607 /DNA_START=42 /DNA_END=3956 /DNA_ORIENTATION=+